MASLEKKEMSRASFGQQTATWYNDSNQSFFRRLRNRIMSIHQKIMTAESYIKATSK